MNRPRIEITTYADGKPAILVYLPGEPGGWPIEDVGGAEVLRRFRTHPDAAVSTAESAEHERN